IAAEAELRGPSCNYVQGELAGALALHAALNDLRERRADTAIVVTCDSLVYPSCWLMYESAGMLSRRRPEVTPAPFDVQRDGLVLGEGAGVLVLQRAADARSRGTPILAEIDGVHFANAVRDTPRARIRARREALAAAASHTDDARHFLVVRGLGTARDDAEEAESLKDPPGGLFVATALKGATGYLGAATAVVELIFGLRMVQAGVVPAVAHLAEVDPTVQFPIAQAEIRLDSDVRQLRVLSGDWQGEAACLVATTAIGRPSRPATARQE
ncbi:MAG: beta-ketoacyl synthase N-terminal-like domain-containing protein, partial [Vicinamibacterales bacterium]